MIFDNFISECKELSREIKVFKKHYNIGKIDYDKYIIEINEIIKETKNDNNISEENRVRIDSIKYLIESWANNL